MFRSILFHTSFALNFAIRLRHLEKCPHVFLCVLKKYLYFFLFRFISRMELCEIFYEL